MARPRRHKSVVVEGRPAKELIKEFYLSRWGIVEEKK